MADTSIGHLSETWLRTWGPAVTPRVMASFFGRAARHEPAAHKARLLRALAREFEPWRQRHARLSRELRDQAYLLNPARSSRPPRAA